MRFYRDIYHRFKAWNCVKLHIKVLEKSGERIIYSRGIPTEFLKEVNEEDIICEMIDFVAKYVLFDDCIDYEVDVLKIKRAPDIVLNVPLTS